MRLRPKSLQWRLSLWLGAGVTILWLVAALITAQKLHHEMDMVFDSALEETGQRLLPLAVSDILGRDPEDDISLHVASMREHDEYFTYVVRTFDGQVLLLSHKADLSVFPAFTGMGFSDTPTHRIYSDAALLGSITISVAEPLTRRHAVAMQTLLGLALPIGLLLPLSLIGIWLLVHHQMQPLRQFRQETEARSADDLTPISTDGLPLEILPNALAVNRLLERLDQALAAERSFTSNSAHELRTPVAAALAQTQRLMLETRDTAAIERAGKIEAALQRLAKLSEKLMQLARAEGSRLRATEPTDLAVILRMLVRDISDNTRNSGRILLTLPDQPVLSRIDPDAFAILARNLIENALKHGASQEPVVVELRVEEKGAGILHIANGGAAVAPDLLARLMQPFERGQTQASGTGLGLAIASTIAAGTGGRLEIMSPRKGRKDGFEVRFYIDTIQPASKTLPSANA